MNFMAKLQENIRPDNVIINTIYVPHSIISELGWTKGDILEFEKKDNKLQIRRLQ